METTEQNNELIKVFIGEDMNKINDFSKPGDGQLCFDWCWDWLMPVVEKIEGLGFEVLIGRISCNINRVLDRENPIASFVCGDISKKREIVYQAIVEFINWYNKNK